MVRRFALVFSLLMAACHSTALANPIEKGKGLSRRAQAMAHEVLHQGLEAKGFWVRVHAAEFLLDCGNQQAVEATVSRELKKNADNKPERIGAWRLAYRVADSDQVRLEFEAKLRGVAADPEASDRLHAVESLAKLGIQLPSGELQTIVTKTREKGTGELAYGLWLAVVQKQNQDKEENHVRLASLLLSDDQMTKLRSAYALWHLSNESPMIRDAIIDTGVRTAQLNLESDLEEMAGARNIALAWKVAERFGVDDDIEAGKEQSIQQLSTALKQAAEQSEEVEKILADTLAELGTTDDAERLLKLLSSDHEDVRVSAAHALLRIQIRIGGSETLEDR
ncbi:hypothetical protein [Aeoliella sp.]|uniref:hypothetical protein n=1 Tax=Aeoliella sp. TaxID=2795800 RepID=UPI003CCB89CF